MKPTDLPRHLWPACRRVMLRQAAAMARDMLDHADDLRLRVSRTRLEHIERSALHELAAARDTVADAPADLRRLPPEMAVLLQQRTRLGVQLRQMFHIMRSRAARQNTRPLVESAWRSLAEQLVVFIASAPQP
jgi:hypothetical protein